MGSARVSRVGDRVLAVAEFSSRFPILDALKFQGEDCFGGDAETNTWDACATQNTWALWSGASTLSASRTRSSPRTTRVRYRSWPTSCVFTKATADIATWRVALVMRLAYEFCCRNS